MQSGKSFIYREVKEAQEQYLEGPQRIQKNKCHLEPLVGSVRIDLSIGVFFPGYEVCKAASEVGQCQKLWQSQGILDQFGYHCHV